jgi:DNA-binding transcriptional ArsR family regulator
MDSQTINDELLGFFKALADANRLKIVGLLAKQPYSVEQLAEILEVRPSTVSHHLAKLSDAGLVHARAESYYNIYYLDTGALEEKARRLLAEGTLPAMVADIDTDAYDRKVLTNFTTPEGRVKAFPAQRKKMEAILRYVLKSFEPGKRYSEKDVNELLLQYYEDYTTLRRELVDYRMLAREGGGGDYWLVEEL